MSKEKTPIEELIEYCKKNAEYVNDCNGNNVVAVDYELMTEEFDSLLKKEREAIEEAYQGGRDKACFYEADKLRNKELNKVSK